MGDCTDYTMIELISINNLYLLSMHVKNVCRMKLSRLQANWKRKEREMEERLKLGFQLDGRIQMRAVAATAS